MKIRVEARKKFRLKMAWIDRTENFRHYSRLMKIRLMLVCSLLAATPLLAQNFQATQRTAATPERKTAEQSVPGKPLPPKATGVVMMMSEHGLQVINPLASKEIGSDRKNVAPSYVLNPAPANQEDPKPFGGINLFGWEF